MGATRGECPNIESLHHFWTQLRPSGCVDKRSFPDFIGLNSG
jgi:hypothetical protein